MNKHISPVNDGADQLGNHAMRLAAQYEESIEEQADLDTIKNLAPLLENESEGVELEPLPLVPRFLQALHEDDHETTIALHEYDAMESLHVPLLKGTKGGPRDVLRAVSLDERAILLFRDPDAMMRLAVQLDDGATGLQRDTARAADLYERVIAFGGDSDAMRRLASLLEKGSEGVPKDLARAAALYERAVQEGDNLDAMSRLAALLERGDEGLTKDVAEAVAMYERLISSDLYQFDAAMSLGHILERGDEGVPKDIARAVVLYERLVAIDRHFDATMRLASILERGAEGVPKDTARAASLYRRILTFGRDFHSMRSLAILLEKGLDGVQKDATRAIDLYQRLDAFTGDPYARKRLDFFQQRESEGVLLGVEQEDWLSDLEYGLMQSNVTKPGAKQRNSIMDMECVVGLGVDLRAMKSLASLVGRGAEGVPRDIDLAVALDKRVTELSRRVDDSDMQAARIRMDFILNGAAIYAPRDSPLAIRLYERLATSDRDFDATMRWQAICLEKGIGCEAKDLERATDLYQQMVVLGGYSDSVRGLASIQGAEEVPKDSARANPLHEGADYFDIRYKDDGEKPNNIPDDMVHGGSSYSQIPKVCEQAISNHSAEASQGLILLSTNMLPSVGYRRVLEEIAREKGIKLAKKDLKLLTRLRGIEEFVPDNCSLQFASSGLCVEIPKGTHLPQPPKNAVIFQYGPNKRFVFFVPGKLSPLGFSVLSWILVPGIPDSTLLLSVMEELTFRNCFVEEALPNKRKGGKHEKVVVPTAWLYWLDFGEDFVKRHGESGDRATELGSRGAEKSKILHDLRLPTSILRCLEYIFPMLRKTDNRCLHPSTPGECKDKSGGFLILKTTNFSAGERRLIHVGPVMKKNERTSISTGLGFASVQAQFGESWKPTVKRDRTEAEIYEGHVRLFQSLEHFLSVDLDSPHEGQVISRMRWLKRVMDFHTLFPSGTNRSFLEATTNPASKYINVSMFPEEDCRIRSNALEDHNVFQDSESDPTKIYFDEAVESKMVTERIFKMSVKCRTGSLLHIGDISRLTRKEFPECGLPKLCFELG